MANDFGVDLTTWLSLTPDMDPTFTLISGARVVGESVARRWVTPVAGLFYDESYGFDTRLLLNSRIDASMFPGISMQLEKEALKDERVQTCSVRLAFNAQTRVLSIHGSVTPFGDKTFALVLSFDQLSSNFSLIFPGSV